MILAIDGPQLIGLIDGQCADVTEALGIPRARFESSRFADRTQKLPILFVDSYVFSILSRIKDVKIALLIEGQSCRRLEIRNDRGGLRRLFRRFHSDDLLIGDCEKLAVRIDGD